MLSEFISRVSSGFIEQAPSPTNAASQITTSKLFRILFNLSYSLISPRTKLTFFL